MRDLHPSSNKEIPTSPEVTEPKLTLIGNDVTALCPNLSADNTARIAKKAIIDSEVDFKGFDMEKGLAYNIAINSDLVENLEDMKHLIPKRKFKTGTKPTMASITSKLNPRNQWEFKDKDLTEEDKKKIIGTVVGVAIKILFNNFTYKFGGKYYHQRGGGPIGVRATGDGRLGSTM